MCTQEHTCWFPLCLCLHSSTHHLYKKGQEGVRRKIGMLAGDWVNCASHRGLPGPSKLGSMFSPVRCETVSKNIDVYARLFFIIMGQDCPSCNVIMHPPPFWVRRHTSLSAQLELQLSLPPFWTRFTEIASPWNHFFFPKITPFLKLSSWHLAWS